MPFGTIVSTETLFGSLKGFQSRLTTRASTNVFLWPSICLKFMNRGQDVIYLSLKNCSLHSLRNTVISSQILPINSRPSPLRCPGLICKPDEPFNYRWVPGPLAHSSLVNIVTLYLGSRLKTGLITSTHILTLWRRSFFKIFTHPVFKMWIIQEPNKVELWNKRHFKRKERRLCSTFKIFSTNICWISI
jgi:hypothetical protein